MTAVEEVDDHFNRALLSSGESARDELVAVWAELRTVWRDDRAGVFGGQVVDPVVSALNVTLTEFRKFAEFWDDARGQIETLGLIPLRSDERELARRQTAAVNEWQGADGRARSGFSVTFGQFAHQRFEEALASAEESRGRLRGVDFDIEYHLPHPDGGSVRLDYVDLRNHRIVDFKTARPGQSEKEVALGHLEQRQRHIDAYVARFGVVPAYTYQTYPSSDGLSQPE